MPFVPLPPQDKPKVCIHPGHNPPNMMVIREPMKWVCPACGASVILRPTTYSLQYQKDKLARLAKAYGS